MQKRTIWILDLLQEGRSQVSKPIQEKIMKLILEDRNPYAKIENRDSRHDKKTRIDGGKH